MLSPGRHRAARYVPAARPCIALAGGAIPEQGAKLEAEDGLVLEVLEATPRRVRTVRIHLPAPQPAEA